MTIDHPHLIHSDVIVGDTMKQADTIVVTPFMHIWVSKSQVSTTTPTNYTPYYSII